jgi:hypothetical protein
MLAQGAPGLGQVQVRVPGRDPSRRLELQMLTLVVCLCSRQERRLLGRTCLVVTRRSGRMARRR